MKTMQVLVIQFGVIFCGGSCLLPALCFQINCGIYKKTQQTSLLITSKQTPIHLASKQREVSHKLLAIPDELLDREGALQKSAGFIQRLYWAQFADDTYTGSLRLLKPESSSVALKNESIQKDQTQSMPNTKPHAPVSALLPATAIRYQIESMVRILINNEAESLNNNSLVLNQISGILSASEFSSTIRLRKAFNTYTASLQFGDSFSVNLPQGSSERKRYIQDNDNLLNAKTVIISDLDLRDLHRNQILTLVEDLKAEVTYQQNQNSDDISFIDIREILGTLQKECNIWFGFISEEDVNEALELYEKKA